jgi:hypothetical protein
VFILFDGPADSPAVWSTSSTAEISPPGGAECFRRARELLRANGPRRGHLPKNLKQTGRGVNFYVMSQRQ